MPDRQAKFLFDPYMLALLGAVLVAFPKPEVPESSPKSQSHKSLTPRELMVLGEIVLGHSSKEAARALEISPRTVEFHRANLLKKFGVKNTVELVRTVLS